MASLRGWQRGRASACTGKHRYRDAEEAKRAKAKCEQARGVPLRYYECDFCQGYHLTHLRASFKEAS